MKNILRNSLLAAGLMFSINAAQGESTNSISHAAAQDWPAADSAAVDHWRSLRFGMFIHWGPVSLTGHEIGWSRGVETPIEDYDNLYKQFNPTNFDADEWAGIAKAAGMKYIVLTTKHHDGFCLWDTKLTDHNIMNSPFHRDVVKELAAACKKQGIEFGTYYSTCDWYNTNWPATSPRGMVMRKTSDLDAYAKYLQGQISELITNYGPLITIWNDVPDHNGVHYGKRGADTIKLVRRLQPDILINNRTGDGGDYQTPEQTIGTFNLDHPWESCMTVSAHNAWAWGGANDGVKPVAACLDMLIRGAGGDGNILLNVGPRPDGVIDPAQADLLKQVGDWLAINGESIYGTRGGPWKPTGQIVSTRKGNDIYLHVLKSENGRTELPALPAEIKSASLLNGGKVEFSQKDGKLSIIIPQTALEPVDTIVKLEVDRPAMEIPVVTPVSGIKATASNVYKGQTEEYGPQLAFDNAPQTRWATDSGTKQCWIAADLGRPVTIQGVRIEEAAPYAGRVTKFDFQCRAGSDWKTLFSGDQIGDRFEKKFAPVTAREFRLNIFDATDGPTISEIEVDRLAMEIPAITLPAPVSAQSNPTNLPTVSAARVKQLQDLHWGMFVCWSFSTFSGREWTPGVTNINLFAAKDCDTDQWVKAAKDAGMGYILFLAKHHDGFCLWDTQTTDRKVTKAPLGRDVLAEVKKSCDKYGLKLAIYFSEGEWAWPGGVPGQGWQSGHIGKNPEMKKTQLKELLTRYGSVEYIWFDYAVGDGGLSHAETVQWVKQFQPNCFVGFNAGSQAGADIRLGEEGHPAPLSDQDGAGFNSKHMSDAHNYWLAEFTYPILPKHQGGASWFYSLPEHDHLCLPAEKIYADYLGAVKYGNIFSLDVGPDYNGRLRGIDVKTLHRVGELIRKHASESSNTSSPSNQVPLTGLTFSTTDTNLQRLTTAPK